MWPLFFFFSSRRRHTRFSRDWSSDVCSSDLDHLRHRVHLRGEPAALLAHVRPGPGEALVGDPAEQLYVAGLQLLPLEIHALRRRGLEAPAAVLEVLRAARILHHAVQRDELGDHQLAHDPNLSRCRSVRSPYGGPGASVRSGSGAPLWTGFATRQNGTR